MTELLEQIKNNIAKENGYETWYQYTQSIMDVEIDKTYDKATIRYATEVAKRSLESAKNIVAHNFNDGLDCKKAITDESNILL